MSAYNKANNSSTGYSPHELIFLFDIVEKTRLQVDANLHAVNESLLMIQEEVKDIQNNLASTRRHLGITNLLVQFNTFSGIICTEIDLLQNAVLFAKRDVLHPSVVNSNHLKEVLSSITLPPNRKWISDIHNEEINVILSHCKIMTVHRSHHLLFAITFPIVELTYYTLYHCFPLPTLLVNNTYYSVEPHSPYFLPDFSQTINGYLPSFNECAELFEDHYICSIETLQKAIVPSCEFNLFSERSDGCKYHYSAFIASIWHRISPNQWFYVISGQDTLTVQFSHEKSTSYTLPRSGIITPPSGTTGYTSSRVFHAGISNSTTIQGTITIPEVPIANVTIPVITPEYTLPVINRLDLADIHKSREALAEAIADSHYSQKVSESFVNVHQFLLCSFNVLTI
ncbi:hypothetical protein V9T40_007207 [Parthenolecanium corni]|uniref:Envelope protein n=1 Tax=Parthenolecanium corni TaxID=536013 RepID=A0AAN9TU56_9HEMI